VAKAVYNLMNNITFGEKEPYMTPMNAFISTYNVNVVQQFMRDLVVLPYVCVCRVCCVCERR
jgi:hypothetical protein